MNLDGVNKEGKEGVNEGVNLKDGKDNENENEYNPTGEVKTVVCPECGNKIEMAEGCFICLNCGYSGCS